MFEIIVIAGLVIFFGLFLTKKVTYCLDQAGGNVTKAMRVMLDEKLSFCFGNCGSYGPVAPSVNARGKAGTNNPILAWYPEGDFRNSPNLEIPWKEVFQYVQDGKKRAVQMEWKF